VADARAPRDGSFIEKIGFYNPMTSPATIELDREKAYDWLVKGAQPTDTARAILRFKGVLYRKHLMRGVNKGALTIEQADEMHQKWIDDKEAKIADRREAENTKHLEWLAQINGKPKAIKQTPKAEAKAEKGSLDAPEVGTFAESVEQTTVESFSSAPTEEAPAAPEAPAAEPTPEPVAEAPAPEPVAETPAPEPVAEAPAAEPVVEEAPAPVAPAEPAAEVAPDDLKKIEGIGPKIAEILNGGGINTFAALAEASADSVKEMLANAEGNFAAHDPTTWHAQAKMAADGEWDKLKKWQDELDGGKVVAPKED